jgi:hypothetical protein
MSDAEIQKRIQQANSVAEVLRSNVVQGVSDGNGVYSKLKPYLIRALRSAKSKEVA